MAERRMFTQKIIGSDMFTSLPPTTQALYFHLCMTADDDGFCNKIRQALFNAHASINDFDLLISKRFVLPFDNGVIVIKHWRMHNLIRNDRYHETAYVTEKAQLVLKTNGAYTENTKSQVGNQMATNGIPSDNQMDTTGKPRLDKSSLVKDSIYNNNGDSEPENASDLPSEDVVTEFFETCWKAYPKKKGKGQVSDSKKNNLQKSVGTEQMLRCIERYKQDCVGKDERFIMYGSTFFNSGYVDYLDENYGEEPKATEPEVIAEEQMVGTWDDSWDTEDDGWDEFLRRNGG